MTERPTVERCEATFMDDTGWHLKQCAREGKYEEQGKHWCKQHSPSVKAERDAARRARWEAERKPAAELHRRAACFPELVAALEWLDTYLANQPLDQQAKFLIIEKVKAALAKAKNQLSSPLAGAAPTRGPSLLFPTLPCVLCNFPRHDYELVVAVMPGATVTGVDYPSFCLIRCVQVAPAGNVNPPGHPSWATKRPVDVIYCELADFAARMAIGVDVSHLSPSVRQQHGGSRLPLTPQCQPS